MDYKEFFISKSVPKKDIKKDIGASREKAKKSAKGVVADTNESVEWVVDILKKLREGEKNVLANATVEVDDYISHAIALRDMLEKWDKEKGSLLKIIGEDNETILTLIPVLIIARTLSNFNKRSRYDGES